VRVSLLNLRLAVLLLVLLMSGFGAAAQTTGGGAETGADGAGLAAGLEDFLPAYPLSVGDVVFVKEYTPTYQGIRATIDGNGDIVVPPLGRVQVLGLTLEEAAERIERELAPYYKSITVTLELVRLSAVRVFVFGTTDKAGVFTLKGGTTALEFLQQLKLPSWGQNRRIHHFRFTSFFLGREGELGGKNSGFRLNSQPEAEEEISHEIASSLGSSVKLLKLVEQTGAETTVIDPTDFVAEGELKSKNFLLRDGDVIYFPPPGKSVEVFGTMRPGVYEVLPDEGLLEVMHRAGDVAPEKNLARTVIERLGEEGGLAFVIVDLDKYYFSTEEGKKIPLENGDRIKLFPREQFVTIIGAVNAAGRYPFEPDLSVSEYLALAGGIQPEAHTGKVFLARGRWNAAGSFETTATFEINLDDFIAGRGGTIPPVMPGDVLFVPQRDQLRKRDIVGAITSLTISALALFK
jgi:protein involved in polysaccharide export with SLBB domain